MCATDCGRCIDCIETDDYAPTWRNPRFQPPVSANGLGDQIATNGRESTTHVRRNTPLSRDGGEPR